MTGERGGRKGRSPRIHSSGLVLPAQRPEGAALGGVFSTNTEPGIVSEQTFLRENIRAHLTVLLIIFR